MGSEENTEGYVSFGVPEFEKVEKRKGYFVDLVRNFITAVKDVNSLKSKRIDNDFSSQNNLTNVIKEDLQACGESDELTTNIIQASKVKSALSPSSRVSAANSGTNSLRLPERRYWMLDENCKNCFECGSRFTAIRRKHHCRVCGRIFCNECSNHFVEGILIGLTGPQRACGYCADFHLSAVKLPGGSVINDSVISNQFKSDDTSETVTSLISRHSFTSSNPGHSLSIANRTAGPNSTDSRNVIYSAPSTGPVQSARAFFSSTLRFRGAPGSSAGLAVSDSEDSSNEHSDMFPSFISTFSNNGISGHQKRLTPPVLPHTSNGLRQSWGPNDSHSFYQLAHLSSKLCATDSPNILSSSHNLSNGAKRLLKKRSSFHSLELLTDGKNSRQQSAVINPSDRELFILWTRIWDKVCEESKIRNHSNVDHNSVEDYFHYDSKKARISSKPFYLIKLRRDNEEVNCISGLVLVYWLVSNIPELNRCRFKGREICQRYMNLSLLVDFRNPTCKKFRDDFTMYELKSLNLDTPLTPCDTHEPSPWSSAVACPYNSSFRALNTHSSLSGPDEPDWLLEIKNLFHTKSGLSTPVLSVNNLSDVSDQTDLLLNEDSGTFHEKSSKFELGQDVNQLKDLHLDSPDLPRLKFKSSSKSPASSESTLSKHRPTNHFDENSGNLRFTPQENVLSVRSAYDEHIYQLVSQEIRENLLDSSWIQILINLAWKVCQLVRFDIRTMGMRYFTFNQQNLDLDLDISNSTNSHKLKSRNYSSMDIRYYVHIKKLLAEDNSDSDLFPGTIFTKCVTNKLMSTLLHNPRVLLLDSAISYQRTTSKMTWLESQIMQEDEYITNCVSKILSLHPNIIFVGGTVSHLAQNFLLKSGITLFANVKRSVLYRIARITGADILDSVDRLISNPSGKSDVSTTSKPSARLGVCRRFEIKRIHLLDGSTKFLTLIENNALDVNSTLVADAGDTNMNGNNGNNNNNGDTNNISPLRFMTNEVTVILRDSDLGSLFRAKRVFLFVLYTCFNALLEMSYANNVSLLCYDHSYLNSKLRQIRSYPRMLSNNTTNRGDMDISQCSSPIKMRKSRVYSRFSSGNLVDTSEDENALVSNLAAYLKGRILSLSPSVYIHLPYLTSTEGQSAPLYAYYTYVIDWPFGRKLNDLMKRKLKIIRSELYALKYASDKNLLSCGSVTDLSKYNLTHPFINKNLGVYLANFQINSNITNKRNYFNYYYLTRSNEYFNSKLNEIIVTETLNPIDEALYLDFKARAYMTQDSSSNSKLTTRKFSRLWAGLGSLLSGHWNSLYKIPNIKVSTRSDQLAKEPENVKRLGRSILDPRSHQSLSFLTVLFTPKSFMWPEPCVPMSISSVDLYGPNDLPLGFFLERFCFMQQHCRNPHCSVSMLEHVQRFIQTSGCVQLVTQKLNQDLPKSILSNDVNLIGDSKFRRFSRIQMWLFCPICRLNSPVKSMSTETWHLSFVKFLDLLLNSSQAWGRCAMRNNNITGSTYVTNCNNNPANVGLNFNNCSSVESCDLTSTIADLSPETNRASMHSVDTGLQTQCPHSVYKCLHHCFAADRKLAIFKYQPVNVFEVVMPPNEIRVISPIGCKENIYTSSNKYANENLVTTRLAQISSTSVGLSNCQMRINNNNNKDNININTSRKVSYLPYYLYNEAIEILSKFSSIHATIKYHIISLKTETLSCELAAMLEAYLNVLETDTTKPIMDQNADFLNYLIHTHQDDKPPSQENHYLVDPPQSVLNSLGLISSNLSSYDIQVSNVIENDNDKSNTNEIKTFDLPILNNNQKSNDSEANIFIPPTKLRKRRDAIIGFGDKNSYISKNEDENKNKEWSILMSGLDCCELIYVIQRLINELKRWLYKFVSDWNVKFNEYDILMKRIEKNIRDTRKKAPLNSQNTPLISPTPEALPFNNHPLEETSKSSTTNDLFGLTKSTRPDNEQNESINSQHDHNKLMAIKSFNDLTSNPSDIECQIVESDYSDPKSGIYIPTLIVQEHLDGSVEQSEFDHSSENWFTFPYSTNNLKSDVFKTSMSALDLVESDCAMGSNQFTKSNKCVPILDPINLKAVYQNREMESCITSTGTNPSLAIPPSGTSTNLTIPVSPRLHKLSSSDNPLQSIASMANVSLSASSGVRRFIHTLLPSTIDSKVFGEPIPLCEHPQLVNSHENIISILKVLRQNQHKLLLRAGRDGKHNVINSHNVITDDKIHNNNSNVAINLPCQLLFTTPDVYINDKELTSIIAFALTLPEYERKLVDLHSSLNGPLYFNSAIQLGQSVLSDGSLKETHLESDSLEIKTPLDNGKSNRSRDLDINRLPTVQVPLSVSPNVYSTNQQGTITQPTQDKSSGVGTSRHIKIQFADNSTNFFCCVYYASEFFRLRQLLMPNGDSGFIRSLSRCYQWDARGGKSGSLFMKTRDERFVIKELSSIEMKTFHEISQQYFDYLISSALDQRLCLLSRILGIFHVGFKNSASGEAHRFDVLVMENLFHGRNHLAYIYDLKGSLRKRLAVETNPANLTAFIDQTGTGESNESSSSSATAGLIFGNNDVVVNQVNTLEIPPSNPISGSFTSLQSSETAINNNNNNETTFTCLNPKRINHRIPVLLDQNLLNASIDNPLYLRVHSKNALSHCLQVDTSFLANLFIMDYSLLVGVDTSTNQLVVGLIDYLRKFTLDKRLEMLIKQTITSAQGPMPTILTPDLYRERFLYQLHSYFPLVPDQWYDSLTEHAEVWHVRTRIPCVQMID